MNIGKLLNIISLVCSSCCIYAQKDSAVFCEQYITAINYIKHDTLLKQNYDFKKYRFKFSEHMTMGCIGPLFKGRQALQGGG